MELQPGNMPTHIIYNTYSMLFVVHFRFPQTVKIRLLAYPCRCLCRFSVQITRTLPLRRIILQFLQIFLTEALTFILITHILPFPYQLSIKLSRTILT